MPRGPGIECPSYGCAPGWDMLHYVRASLSKHMIVLGKLSWIFTEMDTPLELSLHWRVLPPCSSQPVSWKRQHG